MATKRAAEFGNTNLRTITWTNNESGCKGTYTINVNWTDPRCHCHTHHRFCCLAGSKVDERPDDLHTSIKRESSNPKRPKRKARGKRG